MSTRLPSRGRSRLAAVAAVTTVAALALTACSSGSDDASSSSTEGSHAVTGDASQVEVFTWWASGSEKLGLDALVKVFGTQHPDTKFVNGAVAGGAGSAAKDLLASRLAKHDPPDTFQAHAGAELQDYIDAGQVEDISSLYDEFGLRDAFPQDLIDRLTVDGKIYSIPAGIHRANVVWANPKVLEFAGVDPATKYSSLQDWMKDLEKIKKSGKQPLAIATTWTQVQLLENVFLADLGPEGYSGLWTGVTNWNGATVKAALDDFSTLMSYTNKDRDGLDWGDATQRVIDGEAAYNIMGDWAEAAFEEAGKKSPDDYTYFPTPGTDGMYDFLADSFTLPVGAQHPGGAKAWLDSLSSRDGQVGFNKAKGSIPARIDADPSQFSPYQQDAMASFKQDIIVPSLAHGAAVPVSWLTKISDATAKFTTGDSDVTQFQADLFQAAINH
ncbi:ABC transporter substrate-binding protein [Cellulomonas sp. HZM]|uniref:ABC transporter substrate-binding protein n=1 Tax=Cellulomonas sp. HZM TaxID=1454010 RepID=UPI000550F558|nr:ABC transporter substrate-binding protein [Cellulomonas sp. HZM]